MVTAFSPDFTEENPLGKATLFTQAARNGVMEAEGRPGPPLCVERKGRQSAGEGMLERWRLLWPGRPEVRARRGRRDPGALRTSRL